MDIESIFEFAQAINSNNKGKVLFEIEDQIALRKKEIAFLEKVLIIAEKRENELWKETLHLFYTVSPWH